MSPTVRRYNNKPNMKWSLGSCRFLICIVQIHLFCHSLACVEYRYYYYAINQTSWKNMWDVIYNRYCLHRLNVSCLILIFVSKVFCSHVDVELGSSAWHMMLLFSCNNYFLKALVTYGGGQHYWARDKYLLYMLMIQQLQKGDKADSFDYMPQWEKNTNLLTQL